MNVVDYIFHVTSDENFHLIILKKSINLNSANDYDYDGDLAAIAAPKVVYFTASYYKSRLPDISTYPRCSYNRKCQEKSSRLLLKASYIVERIDEYNVLKIKKQKKKSP